MKRFMTRPVAGGLLALGALSGQASAAAPVASSSPALSAATQTTTKAVTTGSQCRYSNASTAAAAGWSAKTFKDSTWKLGRTPLGHLEKVTTDIGVPAKTSYYRCGFDIPTGTKPTAVTIKARVDDGAALSVNGKEVARTNLPTGSVSYTTSASAVDPYDGTRWLTWNVSPALLTAGRNVLAIEVHQNFNKSWISGDSMLDVDVTVTGTAATATPTPVPTTPVTTAPTTPAPTSPGSQWTLLFADEFNGTAVNGSSWKPYHNTYGDADPYMLQCLTPNNVTVSNGTVKLTARKQTVTCPNGKVKNYTSGFLGSRDVGRYYPLYGRFEMRARTPHGQGLFPALWLRHRNGSQMAEVDIFENFHASAPGKATSTLHFPTTLGYNVAKKSPNYETAVQGRGGWHTFSVDILPVTPGDNSKVKFTFAVDGVTSLEYTNNNASAWTNVDKNATWDIALQLWVGGKWTGNPDAKLGWLPVNGGICAQTYKAPLNGDPNNCPKTGTWLAPWNDSTFEVDYVRVYKPA